MRRFLTTSLLAAAMAVSGTSFAAAGEVCKPKLTVKDTRFSDAQRDTQERRWTATVSADASRCATTAGYFDLGVLRQKENAVELEFREQFIWSAPTVMIGINFWVDEAVEDHWIDSVQACPCANQAGGR
jgi:hypothetical protein